MTSSDEPTSAAGHCTECGAALAHDQRYCTVCGARRGPLPMGVAIAVGELADRNQPRLVVAEAGPTPDGADDEPGRDGVTELLPLARAAAVSILLMLGVGSVIGAATVPGGVTSLARTVVVAFSPAPVPAPAPATVASTGGGGGGGAPFSGGGGGGGGGGDGGAGVPAAGPPLTARTVTLPAPPASTQGGSAPTATSPTSPSSLPPIGHVWEIVLSNQGYAQSFGTAKGHPYLSSTLVKQGELVSNYDAVAGSPLANEIALVSGQGPTPQTLADCPVFSGITPGATGKADQTLGTGCLYPSATESVAQQLEVAGMSWRAYVQGIGDPGQTHPPKSTATAPTSTTTTSTTPTTATVPTTGTTVTTTTPTTPPPTVTTTVTTPDAPVTLPAAPTTPILSGTQTTPTSTGTTSGTTPTTGTSTSASGSESPLADTSTRAACPHPATGATDTAQVASRTSDYVTWRNPFVYLHSITDNDSLCAQDDVGLDALAKDLKSVSSTPTFSYISPGPCDDGSDVPCHAGAKAGLGQADAFLKTVIPEIEASPAYQQDGLILITFDNAPQSGPDWSTASCCEQPTFPNLPTTSTTGSTTTGTSTTGTGATGTSTPTTAPGMTDTTDTTGTTGTATTAGCPVTGPNGAATIPTTPTTATSTTATGTTTIGTTSTAVPPAPTVPVSPTVPPAPTVPVTPTVPTTPTAPTTTTVTTTTPSTSTTGTTDSTSTVCQPVTPGVPPGGGQVGLLLISPYVTPGTSDAFDVLNHFSVLKSIEAMFNLPSLGYAADAQVPAFAPAMFTATKR